MNKSQNKNDGLVKTMAEVGIFGALGYVLDFFGGVYSKGLFPNGGSITIALACVFFVAFRRGTVAGVFTGLIVGLLELTEGAMISAYADTGLKAFFQVALDYWLAYPLAGLAGLFSRFVKKAGSNKTRSLYLGLGCLFGGMMKLLAHFLSGVLFWPDDLWGVGGSVAYSFLYNGAYMLPCIILSGALVIFLAYRLPKAFLPEYSLLETRKQDDKKEENESEDEGKKKMMTKEGK